MNPLGGRFAPATNQSKWLSVKCVYTLRLYKTIPMRKYLLFLITCMGFAKMTIAQNAQFFKPFKVDIGFGATVQPSQPAGFLGFIEPSYCFAGRFKTGVRLEQVHLSMKDIGSTALTVDYYFTASPAFRLFAGGGYGYYHTSSSGGCDPGPTTTKTVRSTGNSGAVLRTGFEISHFRFGIEYNFVPSSYVSAVDANGHASSTVVYRNGYFGLKAGVSIGGGKRKL
jgi:hypothetical protein